MLSDAYQYEMKTDVQQYLGSKITEYSVSQDGKRIKVPAENLLQRGVSNLIGRKIIKYSINRGDHGDGSGPGFFGLLLEESEKNLKREWFTLTIRGADEFCVFDGKLLGVSAATTPGYPKPLIYYQGPLLIDNFGPDVNGSTIKDISLQDQSIVLKLEKDGKEHVLEILNKDNRLTPLINYPIIKEGKMTHMPRAAFKDNEKMGEYIIFVEENGKILV